MLFVIGNLYKHMSGLSLTHETKLFHFHGTFMKNANPHTFIHTNPHSRNP